MPLQHKAEAERHYIEGKLLMSNGIINRYVGVINLFKVVF